MQTELVDHLANAIENMQKENPLMGFDETLNKVHLSFGYDGFKKMVREKQKEASRNSWNLLWESFKAQFQWPKIILGVIFFLSFLLIFELADKNIAGKVFKAIPVTLGCYIMFVNFRLFWIQIKSNKMFTIIQASGFAVLYMSLLNLLNSSSPINNWLQNSDKMFLIILSFSFALYSILGIAIIATLRQIEIRVKKEYSAILGVAK
ncbi:MAG: hypothetical protein JST58_04700 [Bacteroidetes bacterium]|nr:hypothetical protein [Bacteroidota bacterium]